MNVETIKEIENDIKCNDSNSRWYLKWPFIIIIFMAICLVIIGIIVMGNKSSTKKDEMVKSDVEDKLSQDIEKCEQITIGEASESNTFGGLFPKQVLKGYVLEDEFPAIFGVRGSQDEVLDAVYYNSISNDEMRIEIAHEEWWKQQIPDLLINEVIYDDVVDDTISPSRIYIKNNGYIIRYYFTTRDIEKINGFSDMINSAVGMSGFELK